MLISKYTFLFKNDEQCYAYNTLSNALLEIDAESYAIIYQAEQTNFIVTQDMIDKELFSALLDANILTHSDEDDYLKYKSAIYAMRRQTHSMHLTIAPTMDCCFRCDYCFEKYKDNKYMSETVMESIIQYVLSQKELKIIKITWFGGEPLMALDEMEKFYDHFIKRCHLPTISNIITTGYHIDHKTIQVLKKIQISFIQITIDGIGNTHNKIKNHKTDQDVFSRVMNNIDLLGQEAPEINVVIRVNLTHENKNEYTQLVDLCSERFAKYRNIRISPAFVLDRGTSDCKKCSVESSLFNHKDRADFIIKLANKGYYSHFTNYPNPFFYECAIRDTMAIAFDPEGYAYKCWEVIGNKDYAIGKLSEEGKIIDYNETILNRHLYGADHLEDNTCRKCKYLPICSGGCPIQRIENKFEGGHNCTCTHYKGYMADFLKIHLKRKQLLADSNNKLCHTTET